MPAFLRSWFCDSGVSECVRRESERFFLLLSFLLLLPSFLLSFLFGKECWPAVCQLQAWRCKLTPLRSSILFSSFRIHRKTLRIIAICPCEFGLLLNSGSSSHTTRHTHIPLAAIPRELCALSSKCLLCGRSVCVILTAREQRGKRERAFMPAVHQHAQTHTHTHTRTNTLCVAAWSCCPFGRSCLQADRYPIAQQRQTRAEKQKERFVSTLTKFEPSSCRLFDSFIFSSLLLLLLFLLLFFWLCLSSSFVNREIHHSKHHTNHQSRFFPPIPSSFFYL